MELAPLDASVLPGPFQEPASAGLADQFETLKITWDPLDVDTMSKLWSGVQSHYRPSTAYQVSVVLIESTRPTSDPLPVLTRKLGVAASLAPALPTIESVAAPDKTAIAELGETITLHGRHLAGTAITVELGHRLLPVPHEIAVPVNVDMSALTFTLPATEPPGESWPPGVWSVRVTLIPSGETVARTTKPAALLLAPRPNVASAVLTRDATTKVVSITVDVVPALRREQTVTVGLNSARAVVGPRTNPTGQVHADLAPLPAGTATLRLRVDGVESRIVDDTGATPVFRADRQVSVP